MKSFIPRRVPVVTILLLTLTTLSHGGESINIYGFATGGRGSPHVVIDSVYQVEDGFEINYVDVWQVGGTIVNMRYLDSVQLITPGVFMSSVKMRKVFLEGIEAYKEDYLDRGTVLFERESEGLSGYEINSGIPGHEVGAYDMTRNGGWVNSLIMGYVWGQYYPWIYSKPIGWLYLVSSTPSEDEMNGRTHFNEHDWNPFFGGISYFIWSETDREWVWLFLSLKAYSDVTEAVLWSYSHEDWYTISEYWPS